MKLKKLTEQLASNIIDAGFDKEFKEIQTASIPKIKSGADLFIIAPEGSGKSTAIVMGVIQQLKKAVEEAPRALVIASTKEKAFELEALFKLLGKRTGLRTFTVFDQGIIQYQKDEIYEGIDIVIGTPKRLNELLNITGIPMTKIKMVVVDNAETFLSDHYHTVIYRIADGVEKAQLIICSDKWMDKFDSLSERIMKNPLIIEAE